MDYYVYLATRLVVQAVIATTDCLFADNQGTANGLPQQLYGSFSGWLQLIGRPVMSALGAGASGMSATLNPSMLCVYVCVCTRVRVHMCTRALYISLST